MSTMIRRLAAVSLLLALGACVEEPALPLEYATPAPAPLQPYMGPPAAYAAPATTTVTRTVKRRYRHYVRRRYRHRVRCRCVPVR